MGTASIMGTAQNQFDELWSAALQKYKLLTGTDLNTAKLPAAGDLEQFRQEVESSQSKFQEYRETRARLWRSLSAILGPIEVLGGVAAGGVSLVCPASPAIMGAISLLFQGAKGVSQAYDYIQELFDDMKAILARIQFHTQKKIPSELHLIFIDMLSCILEIIGVSTKYVSEGRAKLFLKRTFQPDDKTVVLKQHLTKLVDCEVAMVGALNLDTTSNILAQTVLTDCKIEGIAESIQQVAKRLEDSQRMKGDIDSATVLDKIRRILQPQLTVEDDLTRLECLKGTGEWILKEPLFQSWLNGDFPILTITGGPGAGKSHISSLVIRHIQDIYPIGYFFFKENDPLRVDLGIALKTAAYQLGSQKGTLSYLKYLNSICRDSDDFKTLAATWRNLFRVFINGGVNERAFVVLDGVDEAIRDQLEPFLTLLREAQDKSPLSILLVSRPDIDWYIEEVFYETGPPPCVSITARKNTKDIEKYITAMLGKYRNLKKISNALREEIIEVFTEGAEGMFLWVDLMMKELSTKNRESAIRASLKNLPRGLSDTYRRMFQNFAVVLDETEIEDLKELLNWVGFAERPLNLAELECLLALRSGDCGGVLDLYGELCKKYASFFTIVHQSYEEFRDPVKLGDKLNPDPTEKTGDIDEKDIKDDTYREPDPPPHQKLDMIVRLRHASLGDFLKSDTEGPKNMVIGLSTESAQIHLMKTCFKVLLDPHSMPTENTQWIIADDSVTEEPNIMFARYALWNWRAHLRKLPKSISPEDKAFVITSIYNILNNSTFIASHFQNPAKGIQADTSQEYIVEGDFWDPILTWIQDQEGLDLCSPEIKTWATTSNLDRSLLMEPSVTELYRLLLSGKIFPITITYPQYLCLRPLVCIAIYLSKYQNLVLNSTDWLKNSGRDVSIGDIITIMERPHMKRDALWYASVANMLYLSNLEEITQRVRADYCSRALSEHSGIDDLGVILRAKLARAYNLLHQISSSVPSTFQDDKNPVKLMEDAISMAENIHPNLDALGYSELRGIKNVSIIWDKLPFVLRPWICSRRELASMVVTLARLKVRYEKASPSTPEDRNALWEKAFIIDPHSDDTLKGILAHLPPVESHKKLAKMYQKLSGLKSLKEPSMSRLTEHLMFLATSSGLVSFPVQHKSSSSLSKAHEILSTEVGNREFSYGYLQEVLEILQTQGHIPQISIAELAIGNIYEADGEVEKAIELQEQFIAKCIFRKKSGGLKFYPRFGPVSAELSLIIGKMAENISVILSDRGRSETFKLLYFEKLKQLDGFNSIFMATPGYHFHYENLEHFLGPVVALGLYYWLAGDKDTSTKYLKKCIQQSLKCFKAASDVDEKCYVNRNYIDIGQDREWARAKIAAIGWIWLARAASVCGYEDLMHLALWRFSVRACTSDDNEPTESSPDSNLLMNKHGRRWPADNREDTEYGTPHPRLLCSVCKTNLLKSTKPKNDTRVIYICQFQFKHMFCSECIEPLKKGDSTIKICHQQHQWWEVDFNSIPGPKDPSINDEQEKLTIIKMFQEKFDMIV